MKGNTPNSILEMLLNGVGGLFHLFPPAEGAVRYALTNLNVFIKRTAFSAPHLAPAPLCLWISDEGFLYPGVLRHSSVIPVSNWLLVKTKNAKDVWLTADEASQTGLFPFIFIRPSANCHAVYLRRLQLSTERSKSRVFVFTSFKLPHWFLKGAWNMSGTGIAVKDRLQLTQDKSNPLSDYDGALRNVSNHC